MAEQVYTPVPTTPHTDARHMQPLPWKSEEEDKSHSLMAYNGKFIATFYGNDERHPQNMQWCTQAQRKRHIAYTLHACNHFPLMQSELERIYNMEEMPEDAIKAIEALMEKVYLTMMDMPPYVQERKR